MDVRFVESKRDPGRDCFVYTAHSRLDELGIDALRTGVDHDRFGHPIVRGGHDAFAPHTTHMLVMVDGEVVAGTELVAYSPLGLPLSEWDEVGGVLRNGRRLVQCRRPFAKPRYVDRELPELPFGAIGGLFKGCLQWLVARDVSDVVVDVVDRRAAEWLRELGFVPVEGSGPATAPRTHRLGVSELVARGFCSSGPFYRYLLAYDESVLIGEYAAA